MLCPKFRRNETSKTRDASRKYSLGTMYETEAIFSSDAARKDLRYGLRRRRYARGGRSRCHSRSRSRPTTSLNDGLARCDRCALNYLLRLAALETRPAQPPISAHTVPFFRQKKLRGVDRCQR